MPRPVLPRDTVLNLYVPSGQRQLRIADRSAIVGLPNGHGDDHKVEVYYEGAIYDQRMPFEEKIAHAAGRMVDRAPTVAFGFYDEEDLILVGQVAYSERLMGWIVTEVSDQEALASWAGEPVVVGGSDDMKGRAAGIAWSRMSPSRQQQIHMQAQAGGNLVELVLATL